MIDTSADTITIKAVALPFRLKDQWAIWAMQACGHTPSTIEWGCVEGINVLLYHFESTAHTDYEDWMRGSDRPPFDVVRKIQRAHSQFKENLHRFSRQ